MNNSMMTRYYSRKNIPRFSFSYSNKINRNKNNFIHYFGNIFYCCIFLTYFHSSITPKIEIGIN